VSEQERSSTTCHGWEMLSQDCLQVTGIICLPFLSSTEHCIAACTVLAETVCRHDVVAPALKAGLRVLIVAHGECPAGTTGAILSCCIHMLACTVSGAATEQVLI
jgi:hypothetical protein